MRDSLFLLLPSVVVIVVVVAAAAVAVAVVVVFVVGRSIMTEFNGSDAGPLGVGDGCVQPRDGKQVLYAGCKLCLALDQW